MRLRTSLCSLWVACLFGCGPVPEQGDDCKNDRDDDDDGFIDCADPSCVLAGVCTACGDGNIDDNEACDDGNVIDGDGCSSRCLDEECGNGHVDNDEECDDGNLIPADGCSARCEIDHCGDRILQSVATGGIEDCEDGNHTNGDGCSSTCEAEKREKCGNFQVDFDPVTFAQIEQCDDGNRTSGDGCSTVCTFEFCGDGITEPSLNEQCDDGDPFKVGECFGCRVPTCGDFGITGTETCDDGNQQSGDGCSATCVAEFCGDSIVQQLIGEQCDDGNSFSGDGCDGFCQLE